MTEAEWLTATDIYNMLEHLQGKVSDRKFRLFAVACCQRPYYKVRDDRHRNAVTLAERMADTEINAEEWQAVHQAAYELWQASADAQQRAPRGTAEVESLMDLDMAAAAGWAILEDAWDAAYQVISVDWSEKYGDEPAHQLALLRDIFHNPFRPVIIDRSVLSRNDGTAGKLAEAIYEDKTFDRLPVLADALEEVGCVNVELLEHLRAPGPHVRGCWAIDLLLGRS